MIRNAARRVRGWLQRTPLVGTLSGVASLEDSRSADTVLQRFPILDGCEVQSRCPCATPAELEYRMPPKQAWLLRDVVLWPEFGAVVDREGRLVRESIFSPPRMDYLLRNGLFRPFPTTECTVPATTIQLGPAWDNHYHWLIDSLPRLFALHDPAVAQLGPIRLYACGAATPDRQRVLRALLPANVEVVTVPPDVRIRASRFLLVPFLAGDCAAYLPAPYLSFFRRRIFDAFGTVPRSSGRTRVLVSRRSAAKRRFTNADELERQLAAYNFVPVELEHLSLAEQISLFASAEGVVASHGAGLSNLLFSDQCRVVEIFGGPPLAHYRLLATAMGHPYANLVGTAQEKNTDISVPLPALLARLAELGIRPDNGNQSG